MYSMNTNLKYATLFVHSVSIVVVCQDDLYPVFICYWWCIRFVCVFFSLFLSFSFGVWFYVHFALALISEYCHVVFIQSHCHSFVLHRQQYEKKRSFTKARPNLSCWIDDKWKMHFLRIPLIKKREEKRKEKEEWKC